MKIKILMLIVCLAMVIATITAVMVATPAAATAPTTSVTITRWGANSTILFQETIDYTAMQGNFTIWGDGVTHYWLEGPNYPWSGYPDLWDANETENLKDKGALKGTNLKDLCMWAGEPDGLGNSTDTIKVSASDGFYTTLPYANVYNFPAVQGPAVICWWWNGDYTGQGSFTSGMRLVFFAQTTNAADQYVYGDYDMGQTMPEAYQYFNYANHLPDYPDYAYYPSTDGLATKYVSNIDIYTTEVPTWTLQLDGTAIGGANYTMTQQFFAEGIAHHGAVEWLNTAWGGNDTYSGMPLWLLCGWVDDQNEHNTGAFNDALAASGYLVKVTDVTGSYSTTLTSQDVARSNNFIIANQKNGSELTGSEYPLRLVGAGLPSKGSGVKQVAKIELIGNATPTPTPTPTPVPTVTPTPGPVWNLQLVGAGNYSMSESEFEEGVACHEAAWIDGNDTWSGMALWRLCGWVDDDIMHGSGAFNDALAAGNYTVRVIASDGYSKDFNSSVVARNDNMIVANELNGAPLPEERYPLRLVGPGLSGSQKVSNIVEIDLIGLPSATDSTPILGITREVNGNITAGVSITLDGIGPVFSDQNGQFQIMAASTGTHTVVAHKDGFRDRTQTVNVAGLGAAYAVTCNFQGNSGLIPNAPDIQYALLCINHWLYPPNQDIGLNLWTVLTVINAWLYPVQ